MCIRRICVIRVELDEGIGHKSLGGEGGTVAIAVSQARAADEKLPRHANGRQSQMLVEDIDAGIGNGTSEGNLGGMLFSGKGSVGPPHGRDHGCLGRAVGIQNRGTAGMAHQPAAQKIRSGALAADNDESQRHGQLIVMREGDFGQKMPERGGKIEHTQTLIPAEIEECVDIADDLIVAQHQCPARDQGG